VAAIRNIIFDWSGTLVDDLPAVWRASNFVLVQAGLAELSLERFRSEFCLPFKRFYDRFLPHVSMEQLETWFHSHFRTVQDSVVPLPHAREFLEFCRAQQLRTFVLSSVHPEHFTLQVKATGFGEFIDGPYVGVWDKRARIHEILEENRLAPEETLFIGDMQHDIETAKHGGVFSCAVLTGYQSLEQLRVSNPDLIVEHLGELRLLLERHDCDFGAACQQKTVERNPVITVGALIFNDSGQVLMIRTHKWSNLWGIPGGKIKFGERSIDALRREIKEETDLDVTDVRFVLVQDCIHSKEFYRDAHFVLLNYTCRCAGATEVKLNEEANDFRWVTPEEALQMDLNQPTRILLQAVTAKATQ
jgi:phosphoglycolate phosphatase-like HAD superfamily hydrolase/ADP-ribose pyrophosphatase YjhB (NUDIX family)